MKEFKVGDLVRVIKPEISKHGPWTLYYEKADIFNRIYRVTEILEVNYPDPKYKLDIPISYEAYKSWDRFFSYELELAFETD